MGTEVTERLGATGNVHWDKEDASDWVIYVNEYDSGLVDCLGQKMGELVDNFQSKFIEIYINITFSFWALKRCADYQGGHRNAEENKNQHWLKYREDAASQEEPQSSSDGTEQVVYREWIVLGHLGSNS